MLFPDYLITFSLKTQRHIRTRWLPLACLLLLELQLVKLCSLLRMLRHGTHKERLSFWWVYFREKKKGQVKTNKNMQFNQIICCFFLQLRWGLRPAQRMLVACTLLPVFWRQEVAWPLMLLLWHVGGASVVSVAALISVWMMLKRLFEWLYIIYHLIWPDGKVLRLQMFWMRQDSGLTCYNFVLCILFV